MHPAYAARLEDTSERLDHLLAPIAGLPGVPSTMEQYRSLGQEPPQYGFFGFGDSSIAYAAIDAVFPPQGRYGMSDAQAVICIWLVEQADVDYPFLIGGPDVEAAVDRFAVLSPEEQRAWLETNWDALRAGELTLDDLP